MRRTRWTTLLMLLACLPACATYSVMPDPVSTLKPPQTEFKQVRVLLRTGAQFNLRSPRVEGDSLRGTGPDSLVQSIALTDIAAVQVKRTSIERTAGLVVLSVAAAVGVLLTVAVFPLD